MQWVTHYDIAAIIMEIIIFGYTNKLFRQKDKSSVYFLLMLIFNLVATVFDLVTVYTYVPVEQGKIPVWAGYLFSMIYYYSENLISPLLYMYILSLLNGRDTRKIEKIWFYCVVIFYTVIIFTTGMTKAVFYFEDGVYTRGPIVALLYFIAYMTFMACLIITIKNRYRLIRSQRIAVYSFICFVFVCVVIQMYIDNILLTNYASTVSLLLVFLSIQNPEIYKDPVTGMSNAKSFYSTVDIAISNRKKFTSIIVEIDGFKYIKDTFGNENVEELVIHIAGRLSERCRKKRLFYLGDVRFGIITYHDDVITITEELWEEFAGQISVSEINMTMLPLICYVNYPDAVLSSNELASVIDYAFTESRDLMNEGTLCIGRDFLTKKQRQLAISHLISQAITNDGFTVHYQPIKNVKTGKFSSAEALVRLIDSDLGFISPEEFIPIAEKNGKILKLGEIVFEKVCKFLASGSAEKHGIEYIEVNLSVVQCMQANLAEKLISIIDKYNLPYSAFNLEITETADFVNNEMLISNMNKLLSKGIQFSMDDYGTGFSTSDYLIELPFKMVKIDKSIVWSAMSDEKAFKILKYTVAMMKSLELEIVAEGVETKEMAETLINIGCDFLQGFYYSRPISENAYIEFLKK